jgi:hypothetical protein
MSCHKRARSEDGDGGKRRSVRLVEDARSEGRRNAFFHEQEETLRSNISKRRVDGSFGTPSCTNADED